MAARTEEVRADRRWGDDPFDELKPTWPAFIREYKAMIGFGFAALALAAGWLLRETN